MPRGKSQERKNPDSTARIGVLICTFNRHEWLRELLEALVSQVNELKAFVVVVDNGTLPAAEVVKPFKKMMTLRYERLTQPGLSTARNSSMQVAVDMGAEFLAFIDDDEVPAENWLRCLLATQEKEKADIVMGPVQPIYDVPPPKWIVDGGFFVKHGDNPGTENLLLRRSALPASSRSWFDPTFDFSGGEDNEFLSRLVGSGFRLALASDALVSEHVPASRLNARHIIQRGSRDGAAGAKTIKKIHTNYPTLLLRLSWACLAKIGYGFNHLFWSMTTPWRFHRAMADFASAIAIFQTSLGRELEFYGREEKNEYSLLTGRFFK